MNKDSKCYTCTKQKEECCNPEKLVLACPMYEAMNKQSKKQVCPQCGELLVFPKGDEPYCEDCGWPDEDFDEPND